MPEGTDKNKSWLWLRKCDLKIPSEVLICSAQEQARRTNCQMSNTTLINVLIHLLVECVARQVKKLVIS